MNNLEDIFFDDCVMCQAQKTADKEGRSLTLSELREAFRKARDNGAIGNEW